MLNKSKGKRRCGHMAVVVSDEEAVGVGLRKGREPVRPGLSELRGARVAALGTDPARLLPCS